MATLTLFESILKKSSCELCNLSYLKVWRYCGRVVFVTQYWFCGRNVWGDVAFIINCLTIQQVHYLHPLGQPPSLCYSTRVAFKWLLDASCYNCSMSFIILHTTRHHPEATSSTPFPKLTGLAWRWEIMFWQSVHECVPDTWGILGGKTTTKFFSTFPWAAQMFGWWLQSPNHITA